MSDIFLIMAANRVELREHLKMRRRVAYCTRMESIKYYVPSQPVFAVPTLADALVECRKLNKRRSIQTYYWSAVMLIEPDKPLELEIG